MSLLRTEYKALPDGWLATRTVCGECGRGLNTPTEWSDCRRRHFLERNPTLPYLMPAEQVKP